MAFENLDWEDTFAFLLFEGPWLADEHVDNWPRGLFRLRKSIVVVHERHIEDLPCRALIRFDRREGKSVIVCRWVLDHFAKVLECHSTQRLDGNLP